MTYISFPAFELRPFRAVGRQAVPEIRTAGIIGGLAPQSTALFYETVTNYCLSRSLPSLPRILINSVNTWAVTEILGRKDMDGLFAFLKKEAALIRQQADFLAIVCNSVHAVLEPLREMLDLPVLSICEEVCQELALSSIRKAGILGTKTTVNNRFYQEELAKYGIDYVLLPEQQEAAFDAFIFEEMLHGRGHGTMRRLILEGISYLEKQGCEGVILACTELPLFVSQEDTAMPLFPSTQILAHAVIEECYRDYRPSSFR